MNQHSIVVFVCENGAAKSVLAAAYFNKLASEMGVALRAIARGTNPDQELSPQVIKGLQEDGLALQESIPQRLSLPDMKSAERIITFCDLPVEYQEEAGVERWDGVPSVSENYEKARDAIVERISHLLNK